MSNEEDWCFQCQELGHIAQHYHHIRCHECDEYGHIVMDCSLKTSPQEHQYHITRYTGVTTPDQALDTTEKMEKKETGPDHSLDIANITALAVITHTEATPDHRNEMGTAAIEAAQDDPIQHTEDTVTDPTMIHHTGHTAIYLHTTAHQDTALRTAVDQGTQKSHLSRTRKVHIEEPPSDYYSSGDNSTNSGEESESVN